MFTEATLKDKSKKINLGVSLLKFAVDEHSVVQRFLTMDDFKMDLKIYITIFKNTIIENKSLCQIYLEKEILKF